MSIIPINPDEPLLESKRVNPALPIPVLYQALRIGLYDEYRARAFYAMVMERFGTMAARPFGNVRGAEERHAAAMEALCLRYGVSMPMDDWRGKIRLPATLSQCCEIGVQGEIQNSAMYQHFLAWPMPPDVAGVMRQLRDVSWANHLPAFARCAGLALPNRIPDRIDSTRGLSWWGLAIGAGVVWWAMGRKRKTLGAYRLSTNKHVGKNKIGFYRA
uniref:Ferritin-like domain-containing protein n=1 Tax=Candidatus Kentrum sp. FW TaxID=2126338 RepID=A0A450TRI3_9GAMM|nr:MAG: hypothetical protein BECKFW1821B_GA0114236_12025 [Candidatus Kentron sp. FW]